MGSLCTHWGRVLSFCVPSRLFRKKLEAYHESRIRQTFGICLEIYEPQSLYIPQKASKKNSLRTPENRSQRIVKNSHSTPGLRQRMQGEAFLQEDTCSHYLLQLLGKGDTSNVPAYCLLLQCWMVACLDLMYLHQSPQP